MGNNKLHIIPKLREGQKYDATLGSLLLDKAGSFFVTIKEYEEDKKKLKELEEKKKKIRDFADQKVDENTKKGWSLKQLRANFDANMQEWENVDQEAKTILTKYDDLNWAWQLVGNKVDPNAISHNNSFDKGIYEIVKFEKKKIHFPEMLVGGGMAWLEVFQEKEGATGKTPYGVYVQAKGTPRVIRSEWTDSTYKPIGKQKVGFGSHVILHIYTQAMYGQEVEVYLVDSDIFTPDDKLSISDKKAFEREVNLKKVKPFEIDNKGVSGELTKVKQSDDDNRSYVQKIEVEVYIDPIWKKEGGKELKIYPVIKALESDTFFEKSRFENRNCLNVNEEASIVTSLIEIYNKPVMIGQVETNVAHFAHCRYDSIKLTELGSSVVTTVFDSGKAEFTQKKAIEIEIISGKKSTYLLDFEFQTIECERKPKHTTQELSVLSIPKNYELQSDINAKAEHEDKKNEKELVKTESSSKISLMGAKTTQKELVATEKGIVTFRQNQIEFDAFYNYDIPQDTNAVTTFYKAMKYFWLPDLGKDKTYNITAIANTCAFHQNINIAIYPDIKWTLKFGFNVKKEDIEKLNRKGGTFAPFKTFEDKAEEKDKTNFEVNKKNSVKVNDDNLRRKETLERAEKHFTEKYDLKPKTTEITPIDKGTSFKKLLEILSRITISLEEEHYGGSVKNELTEDFVKQLYQQLSPMIILAGKAVGLIEGDYDQKAYTPQEDKSIDGLMAKLKRKPVEYEMLYPKLSCAGSWYYEQIDAKQYPELVGRQGLGVDLMLKATPLIGVSIKWDIFELLCRRHPIAYAVLKAIDSLLYLLGDDESAVRCDFTVSGQIDTTVDLQLNCLAGFKDFNAKGKSAIQCEILLELKLNNSFKLGKFEILAKRGVSTGASIGLGIEDVYGIDKNGIYIKKELIFEGVKFSFKAEGSVELARKEGKRKKSTFKLGGEVSGEITMLDHSFSTDRMYINKILW